MPLFKNNPQGKFNIILCPKHIDDTAVKQVEAMMTTSWVKLSVVVHIFDFKETESIAPSFYRTMMDFKANSKKLFHRVLSINLEKSLELQIKSDGMKDTFSPHKSLQEAIQALQKSGMVVK